MSQNKAKFNISGIDIMPYVLSLCKFMNDNGINLEPYPTLHLSKDKTYVNDVFGRTAWYEPETKSVNVITEGRHPKDVLRSLAHELVHHNQNISGKMKSEDIDNLADPKYAQNNKKLEALEKDAYLRGNMAFRSWEDKQK